MTPTPENGPADGPAFPSSYAMSPQGFTTDHEPGMSLRDWFAGRAMQSMFAGDGARMVANRDKRYDETNWAEVVALNAYEMADAMLTARAQPKGEKAT